MIVGIEVSRLARSCKDWYQLLEICALFDTLIADMDGVYDASLFNDRLLLGLKGTIFEAELHVLNARMQQGRMAKARRGELSIPMPRGFVRQASGEVTLDPDEQVLSTFGASCASDKRLPTISCIRRRRSGPAARPRAARG